MAKRIDEAVLSATQRAELFEGGKVLLTCTTEDPFMPTFIELDAKAATVLFDFLLLHQERLIRHAKAQEEKNYKRT